MLGFQKGTDTQGPVKEPEKQLSERRQNIERTWCPGGQERRESYVVMGRMEGA